MSPKHIDFINKHACEALSATRGSKIFPETLLAQAILESSSGNSQLTRQANNFFGIKASTAWEGPKILKDTTEFINTKTKAYFRVYSGFEASARDYIKFFNSSRYANVRSANNYSDQIKAIKAAGYATDPDYVAKVTAIADEAHAYLNQFGKNIKCPTGFGVSQQSFAVGLVAITFLTTYLIYVRRK